MLTRLIPKRLLLQRIAYSFADKDESEGDPSQAHEKDAKAILQKKFTGQVKIQQKFHGKTSALYDRYLQARERPLVCSDGLYVAYEFVIERLPIFTPYNKKNFQVKRNRYVYAKKTGFYVPLPNALKLDDGDNAFKVYDESNEENAISHQIVLSQTQKINYRQNSRLWRYTDPTIVDPHSIQTYSSDNVFLIVKEKGKWKFPSKVINQKDVHERVFQNMAMHLFAGTKYPNVHFPTYKPMGIRKADIEGMDKPARMFTFKGISAFGIPQYPTSVYEDFAWVPKPLLADYFEDQYFEDTAWAATHAFGFSK